MAKFKNLQVTTTTMVDGHTIDFELLPTCGFVKKPLGYNTETGEPIGFKYAIALSWQVFGIVISYDKK